MPYDLVLAPEAVEDLEALKAFHRAAVRDALQRYLRHEPTKISRSRIQRLRGLNQPQYRLRLGDLRVFYDVAGNEIQVLAIVAKADTDRWLQRAGESDEESGPVGGQG